MRNDSEFGLIPETDADCDALFGPVASAASSEANDGRAVRLTEAGKPRRRRPRNPAAAPVADPFPAEDPWPLPVAGDQLLDAICGLLQCHVVLPPMAAEALALWLVHTYLLGESDYTPYILITSPVRECGKSTLLELLAQLAYRSQLTGGITAAALYRRIDRLHPTMLLDEVDTRLQAQGGENLRAVLNTGFHRSGRMTICVGDDHEERDFATFCPKVLAGIGRIWDTVASRSIPVRLRRATKDELARLRKIRGHSIGAECQPYRQKLLRLSTSLGEALRVADPAIPDQLGARQGDVWRPLFAIADAAGGHWPHTARVAACALHRTGEEEGDTALQLLGDVRDILGDQPEIASATLVEELLKREDRPWPEFRSGRPISPVGVAALLRRFEVRPKNLRRGQMVVKGYTRDALAPIFALYLPVLPETATSATPACVAEVAVPINVDLELASDRPISDGAQLGLLTSGDPSTDQLQGRL